MESTLRFTISGIITVALLAATLTSAIQTQNVFAVEESQVTECLDQFNEIGTSPYVADDLVSIESRHGTYNVSADYVSSQSDFHPNGFYYVLIPTNTQPASAVFEEGRTISFVIRSNRAGVETVSSGSEANVARLYSSDVSDCDIVFDPNPNENSVPADKKFILDSVAVTDLGDGTYRHTVVIPSKAIVGDNFTKLFIEYRDEQETRVYYSLPNIEIVEGTTEVFDVRTECESLPTTGGSAFYADTAGDGIFCEIPAGAELILDEGQTLLFAGIGLFNHGQIVLSEDSKMVVDDGWGMQNYGTILITNGSTLLVEPPGYFEVMGQLTIDSTSVVINRGGMMGPGITNNGTFQIDCTGVVTLGPISGNQPIDICHESKVTLADAMNRATGQSMFADGRTFYGERFGLNSTVVGDPVDCVSVEMRRHGTPTGNAQIGLYSGVIDSSQQPPSLMWEFGTMDVSTLTTGYIAYHFCKAGPVVFQDNMIGVQYSSGDPINRIDVRRSNVGAGPEYDGLQAHHVNYDGKWHVYNTEGNSRDLLFRLMN